MRGEAAMENIYQRYTPEQMETIHLADFYTMLYAILGQTLLDALGIEGEAVLREATRRYGADRGRTRRQNHLSANVKINMKNLFSIGSDLPTDPRFCGQALKLTPEERNHRTLRCPMAELWGREGYQYVGRIYCEEFHPACYGSYAYGYTRVGLARTLTQKGDSFCSFNIILRAENLPEELKGICFEEYDPFFTGQTHDIPRAEGKSGYNSLCVRVYYYLLEVMRERFGEERDSVLQKGLIAFARYAAGALRTYAEEMGTPLTPAFVESHFPFSMQPEQEPLWARYAGHGARKFLQAEFYPAFEKYLGFRS